MAYGPHFATGAKAVASARGAPLCHLSLEGSGRPSRKRGEAAGEGAGPGTIMLCGSGSAVILFQVKKRGEKNIFLFEV